MTTTPGMELTAPGAGPGVYQPASLHSYLWKRMPEKFLKGEPKVLGVMEILIALMNLSFGTVIMCVTLPDTGLTITIFSAYTGYTVWGSVMVSKENTVRRSWRQPNIVVNILSFGIIVQGSLGLNIASSVLALSGVILTAISMILGLEIPYCEQEGNCFMIRSILIGMDVMMFLLSILEFCIAVSLSAYGCKVICCNPNGVVFILPSNPHMAEIASPAPFTGGLMPLMDQQKNVPENVSLQ
uniref:Membrane-spanning 4-domains subfamily A member 4A n=1 Tax=Camelus bactrianus TaxID=9837 RepID=A0A9W3HHU0_CAMBA|nr:membrane-spanning 4-domains subfamily A member 4A [Camelus bactrianus]